MALHFDLLVGVNKMVQTASVEESFKAYRRKEAVIIKGKIGGGESFLVRIPWDDQRVLRLQLRFKNRDRRHLAPPQAVEFIETMPPRKLLQIQIDLQNGQVYVIHMGGRWEIRELPSP